MNVTMYRPSGRTNYESFKNAAACLLHDHPTAKMGIIKLFFRDGRWHHDIEVDGRVVAQIVDDVKHTSLT